MADELTREDKVKLECLRIAAENVGETTSPDDLLNIAGKLAAFVLGEDHTTTELPAPTVKDEPDKPAKPNIHAEECAIYWPDGRGWNPEKCNCVLNRPDKPVPATFV